LRPSGRRVEALGETVVDIGEHRACLIATVRLAVKRRGPLVAHGSKTFARSNLGETSAPINQPYRLRPLWV
jgi:hypothetical protein